MQTILSARFLFLSVVFCAAGVFAFAASGFAQNRSSPGLSVTATPQGAAAKERPLPVGAPVTLKVTLKNETREAIGPVKLSAQFDGMKLENQPDWSADASGKALSEIAKIEAGASSEKLLRLRIEKAPFPASKSAISIEAAAGEKLRAAATVNINAADCVGAFREKLSVLRSGVLQNVRDAADAMRRPDNALPGSRIFPATNARRSDLLNAERLAAALSARGAADAQMSTEWMRFLITRWVSEMTNYSQQTSNPGMCANNYYQIAGQREGLSPVTKRLDAFREGAANALTAARFSGKDAVAADARELVLRLAKSAEIEGVDDSASIFTMLSAIRTSLARGNKLEKEQLETLSLAETAAWLGETDKRGQALTDAIEKVFGTIAELHKQNCICAF